MKVQHTVGCIGWFGVLFAISVLLIALSTVVAAASAEAEENDEIEEVIVTARRVEENVQDIPLSVQVLTGDELDKLNLSRMFDLQYQVPGLVVNSVGMFGAGFTLRGVVDQGGLYLNGVYLGSSHLAIARMFDLDRIEVLKGPQGTLYGRNANGGSINFITRSPEFEPEGKLEGALGSFNTTRLEGHLNVPVSNIAVRLSFIGSEGDGYIRNSVDDRRFGEADFWGLRGSIAVEPNESSRIEFSAQRVYDDGASAELWLPNPDYLPDPNDIHLTTVTAANPYLRIENDFAGLTAEFDVGSARARSITGYASNHTDNVDDCEGDPSLLGCVRTASPLTYKQFSQELQLASNGGERFDWLAGAYWFSGEENVHFTQLNPRRSPLPSLDNYSTQQDTALALFGQASIHWGAGWEVTGGLRFSYEETDLSKIGSGVFDDPEPLDASEDWDHPSWRLDLAYMAREGLLYYAGFSTGFRSGGIVTSNLPDGWPIRYEPEDLLAFETGIKSQWPNLGLTLDAAAFRYAFDNLQANFTFTVDDRLYFSTDNAAEAEVYGLDVAASFELNPRLNLSAAFVWLPKREYVDYTASETGEDLSGNELPRAPEWSAITFLDYRLPLAQHGNLTARLEYSYRSGYFYTRQNFARHAQGAFGLLNLYLWFEPEGGNWYAFATGRNLTDEDYYQQVFIQATPGYQQNYEVGVGFRF